MPVFSMLYIQILEQIRINIILAVGSISSSDSQVNSLLGAGFMAIGAYAVAHWLVALVFFIAMLAGVIIAGIGGFGSWFANPARLKGDYLCDCDSRCLRGIRIPQLLIGTLMNGAAVILALSYGEWSMSLLLSQLF